MFQLDGQKKIGQNPDEPSVWQILEGEVKDEIGQLKKETDEIKLMIEQSRLEVGKLADRNKAITATMQRVQAQFDTLPRDDIRSSYDSALDSQQRLFVMRGQLEKLESDKKYLDRYQEMLVRVRTALEGGQPDEGRPRSSFAAVEMMIQAQESERKRLSRQMHDGPAQALSNFILQTEIAMRLFDMDPEKARGELGNLKTAATTTFQQVREFIFELRPMMLDDLGFIPTIKRYVDALQEQTGLDLTVQVTGMERRLESYLEVLVFRAIQELLGNATRHSQATSIRVQIDINDSEVRALVSDNGQGFDLDILESGTGMGLKLIRERVDMLRGKFDVGSVVGQGTQITFQLPIAEGT
jgi:two-component system sensor histidine kinase DegS